MKLLALFFLLLFFEWSTYSIDATIDFDKQNQVGKKIPFIGVSTDALLNATLFTKKWDKGVIGECKCNLRKDTLFIQNNFYTRYFFGKVYVLKIHKDKFDSDIFNSEEDINYEGDGIKQKLTKMNNKVNKLILKNTPKFTSGENINGLAITDAQSLENEILFKCKVK